MMNETIEQKIERYAELTADDRRSVHEFIAAHPESATLLEEVLAWDRLVAEGRLLAASPPGDEALAYYLVTKRLQSMEPPEPLRTLFQRIEAAVEASPELQDRVRLLQTRVDELQAAMNPVAQFERLTGRPLEDAAASAAPGGAPTVTPGARPTAVPGGAPTVTPEEDAGAPSPEEPGAIRKLSRGSRLRKVAQTFAAIAAVYALLFVGGRLLQPEHVRLAWIDSEELTLRGFDGLRTAGGAGPDADAPADQLYLHALELLRESHRSTVGLFPRLDRTRLEEGAALLQRVVEMEPQDSFLALEASYLLGKARLGLGDSDAARQSLETVVEESGRKSDEAAELLRRLPQK